MKKITIKNLIDFRRKKSESTKRTFVNNLKKEKKKKEGDSDGGNWWVTSTSAISNVFRYDDERFINDKIDELNEKYNKAQHRTTKIQFKQNIDILLGFEDFEYNNIRPEVELTFLHKPNEKSLLDIEGFPIQAWPHHVFTFSENGSDEIGSVWFVAVKEGFTNTELGMYVDIIYRYLKKHYAEDYFVNPKYCVAVDVMSGKTVDYTAIENGDIPILIEKTIDEIKGM